MKATIDTSHSGGWRTAIVDGQAELVVVFVKDDFDAAQDLVHGAAPRANRLLEATEIAAPQHLPGPGVARTVSDIGATIDAAPLALEGVVQATVAEVLLPAPSAPADPYGRRGGATRAWTRELPPDVSQPGVSPSSRWISGDADPWPDRTSRTRVGGASHVGPSTIAEEKENEDFAFHGLLSTRDGDWLVAGVADGVGQSVWPERASMNAAAAFIEALDQCIEHRIIPRTEAGLNPPGQRAHWHAQFAERLCARILARLELDLELLRREDRPYLPCRIEAGAIVDRYKPQLFGKLFFDGDGTEEEIKNRWFQSTLLAAAIGPHGGFALFLGDGYARVDRLTRGENGREEWTRRPLPLCDDPRGPTQRVSLRLTADEVAGAMRKMPLKGARELGILLTTDGVSKSSRYGVASALRRAGSRGDSLDDVAFESSAECRRFLDELAGLGDGVVELDNMSAAFAYRRTGRRSRGHV